MKNMKNLRIILLCFSLLLVSSYAMASVHGMWNMDNVEKRSLKIGTAKPTIEVENFSDVWVFKDDGTFEFKQDASSEVSIFVGTWSQKGSSFNINIDPEQVRIFIESQLLAGGVTANATIKKLHFFGSEKKDWTIKGKYQIKADLVFPDSSKGTLDINGSFIGTLPYDTSEYFPLGLSDTWTTREIQTEITQEGEQTDENIDTKAILGTEKIKGVDALKRGNPGSGSYDLMTNTSGIKVYKSYDADFEEDVLVEETTNTYNPPVLYVPPRLSVGTRHSFKSTVTSKSTLAGKAVIKWTGDMIVEGIEDVTVPAGTFNDCLRIKFVENRTVKGANHVESTEATRWLARGVGIVKQTETEIQFVDGTEVERDISNEELLSATVEGINYP